MIERNKAARHDRSSSSRDGDRPATSRSPSAGRRAAKRLPRRRTRDRAPQPVSVLGAIPKASSRVGDVTVGAGRQRLGQLFSPSGVTDYSKNFTSTRRRPARKADQQQPALRSSASSTRAASCVDGDIWALFCAARRHQRVRRRSSTCSRCCRSTAGTPRSSTYEQIASKIMRPAGAGRRRKLMPIAARAVLWFIFLSSVFLDCRRIRILDDPAPRCE